MQKKTTLKKEVTKNKVTKKAVAKKTVPKKKVVPPLLTPKQFEALPREERCVLIAQDVLLRLRQKQYIAQEGTYVNVRSIKGENLYSSDNLDARTCLLENKLKCVVCARGALFMSQVTFRNSKTIEDVEMGGFSYKSNVLENSKNGRFLGKDFPKKEQRLIEVFFECNRMYGEGLPEKKVEAAIDFRYALRAEWERKARKGTFDDYILKELCKNIIKNKGKFIP